MNPFEAIVIIAVFAIIASVIKNKRRQPSQDHYEHDEDGPGSTEMKLQLMAMKKRIEALETIVTDKKYNLKREIDQL